VSSNSNWLGLQSSKWSYTTVEQDDWDDVLKKMGFMASVEARAEVVHEQV
jgi:hypothetical protein